MKILIATTIVPHIYGGGTQIIDWLELKLKEYGHQADTVKIPFYDEYTLCMEQMLALRLYPVADHADRLVCVRTPSYLLKHPQKYLWFIHHQRIAYDLWDTEFSIPRTKEGCAVREYIVRADELAFSEAKKIYTNSNVVGKRLRDFNGVDSRTVYPPLLEPEKFYCEGYGDYIYYPSRLCNHKRQLLAVEAMRYAKTDVKLLLTGVIETPQYEKQLMDAIREYGLEDKVTIRNEWISEEEKRELMANCLAAAYIPLDEDSYGYPSLEAHHSRKAVVSCTDSGGTDELIADGKNGFLVESDPRALAAVFDQLYEDKALAQRMGEAGLARIGELAITWDNVIGRFTA